MRKRDSFASLSSNRRTSRPWTKSLPSRDGASFPPSRAKCDSSRRIRCSMGAISRWRCGRSCRDSTAARPTGARPRSGTSEPRISLRPKGCPIRRQSSAPSLSPNPFRSRSRRSSRRRMPRRRRSTSDWRRCPPFRRSRLPRLTSCARSSSRSRIGNMNALPPNRRKSLCPSGSARRSRHFEETRRAPGRHR